MNIWRKMNWKAILACCGVALFFSALAPSTAKAQRFNIDDYTCYDVRAGHGSLETLEDQFHGPADIRVRQLVFFCAPTVKNGNFPNDLINPNDHLACYKVSATLKPSVTVRTRNQFGNHTLTFEEASLFCVPTQKRSVEPEGQSVLE